MKFTLSLCAVLLISWLSPPAAFADSYTGTWNAQPSDTAGTVNLTLNYRHTSSDGNEEWNESDDVPYAQLNGLTRSDFNSGGEHKSFTIVRDAGTFRADGWFANGRGSGGWAFEPSGNFRSELERRGIAGGISDEDQFHLAMTNFKTATLDELNAAGFARPSARDLVRMAEHGVSASYIAAMRGVPLNPKTVGELIRMRDHGVTPDFAAAMLRSDGRLTSDELVRLRDHGVSADYLQNLQRLGYHPSGDDLVRLRDHGVTVEFIERLRSHGYTRLSADDLIRLRDHGF